jgi:ATP-dependent Clp protease ATP-binding subunit ClpA
MLNIPKASLHANKAIEIAEAEARSRYKRRVDTSLMLFGLIAQRDSISTVTLRKLGVDIHDLRGELYGMIGKRITHLDVMNMVNGGHIIFSKDVQAAILTAARLAETRGLTRQVEDEDILLALAMMKHTFASVLLEKYGVTSTLLDKELYNLVLPSRRSAHL